MSAPLVCIDSKHVNTHFILLIQMIAYRHTGILATTAGESFKFSSSSSLCDPAAEATPLFVYSRAMREGRLEAKCFVSH